MIRYQVVGLMYTLTCPLACQHCVTESSSKVKARMRLEDARKYLSAIHRFSPTVCFTGGEPLLFHGEIVTLAEQARSLGLVITLVTGAGWVRKESAARSRVRELARAGVDTICISWDRYHEAFAPRERAVMLARLAVDAGIRVKVRSVIPADREADEYRDAFAGIPVAFEAVAPIRVGRATSLPLSDFFWTDTPPTGPCTVVTSAVVEPNGNVFACCGPSRFSKAPSPLVLGNALDEPLEDILGRAVRDPILELIHNLGSYGLHLLLKDHPLGKTRLKLRNGYTSICDLCLEVTNDSELVAAIRSRMHDPDVQPLLAAARLWMNHTAQSKNSGTSQCQSGPKCGL